MSDQLQDRVLRDISIFYSRDDVRTDAPLTTDNLRNFLEAVGRETLANVRNSLTLTLPRLQSSCP